MHDIGGSSLNDNDGDYNVKGEGGFDMVHDYRNGCVDSDGDWRNDVSDDD